MLNILIICTGNSCRSIIGEALFNHLSQGRIQAFSAGSAPLGRLNAGAAALLERHGIATGGLSSKSWDSLENQRFDIVITVCDSAAGETCPVYMRPIPKVHWATADPGHVEGSAEQKLAAFEETYALFERRIAKVMSLPLESIPLSELIAELNKID